MADDILRSSVYSAPPPSPIPTGRGSRSASNSVLSDYIDKALRVPQLTLPHHMTTSRLEEFSYIMIQLKDDVAIKNMLRSARELGVFQISDHGIMTKELESALERSDRVFGLMVDDCTSYGDHEKLDWSSDGHQISGEATALIGEEIFQIFRQEMKKVSSELEAIGQGLARVIGQTSSSTAAIEQQNRCRDDATGAVQVLELGESMMSIYRYHRANIIDRISSLTHDHEEEEERNDEDPYTMSLHLILEPGEICLHLESGKPSYLHISENTIVVTLGKQREKWGNRELKSSQGKVLFKPFLHTNRPSFSIEKRWAIFTNHHQSNRIISLSDQILFALLVTFFYNFFTYFFM